MSRTAITIRAVEPSDLDAIVRIDEKLSGQTRKEYWRQRLEIAALRPPWMSLVAETDGRLVGFLFGWVSESEFGITRPTGWVDLIGVDPPYRGRGVGHALIERFVQSGTRAARDREGRDAHRPRPGRRARVLRAPGLSPRPHDPDGARGVLLMPGGTQGSRT